MFGFYAFDIIVLDMRKVCFVLSVLLILCSACHKKEKVATPTLTKTQETKVKEVKVSIKRYEQALFELDANKLAEGMESLYGQYPDNLVSNGCWKNPQMIAALKGYLSDPTIRDLYKEVQKQYPNTDDLNRELTAAFKQYLKHFPDAVIPNVYTLIPGMDFSTPAVFGYEDNLFICLDMYLGKDCKYYALAGMPKFIAARCDRKYMATDCFSQGICYRHLPDKTPVSALDNMIEAGKKLFFTQTIFPEKAEKDIIKYSEDHYQWAKKHEAAVWQYLIEKNMLYSKDEDVIRRLIDETPFTRDFGNDSPGRMGCYMGWRIVQSYMQNHPETTLAELMANTKSQEILTNSGYKPKF